jgi:hypothetical protein
LPAYDTSPLAENLAATWFVAGSVAWTVASFILLYIYAFPFGELREATLRHLRAAATSAAAAAGLGRVSGESDNSSAAEAEPGMQKANTAVEAAAAAAGQSDDSTEEDETSRLMYSNLRAATEYSNLRAATLLHEEREASSKGFPQSYL